MKRPPRVCRTAAIDADATSSGAATGRTPRAAAEGGAGRIGYVVTAFPRVSETFIINEIIELEHQGFDLHIYSMKRPSDPIRHRLADEIRSPITYLPNPLRQSLGTVLADHLWLLGRSPGAYLSTLRRVLGLLDPRTIAQFGQAPCLVRLIEKHGVTHLHAGFVHSPGSLAWLASLMSGVRYSLAAHARDLYRSSPALLWKKLAAARVVFTCTGYNVRHLERFATEVRVRHVYHGTNLVRFRFGPYGRRQPPLVLAVARFVEKKGLDDLIRACALLRDYGRQITCQIVGSGQLRQSLVRLARSFDLDRVVAFEGPVDQDEVVAWYRQATVLALPCRVSRDGDRDGIPNVLIEAAACGLPIITTPVSGIPELIEDGKSGLLVPPRDPAALARALDVMLHSPDLRERLRLNARKRVEETFDLRRNARTIGRELCAVMNPPPRNVAFLHEPGDSVRLTTPM